MLQELPLDPMAHLRLRAEESVSLSGKVALPVDGCWTAQ